MNEQTLVILKPDCLHRGLVEECVNHLLKVGKIIKVSYQIVSVKQILLHYEDNLKNVSFNIKQRVIDYFVNEPVIILVLEGKNIISKVRKLIGTSDPEKAEKNTIRGKYGNDSYKVADMQNRSCRNLIHASDSKENYKKEFKIWFNRGE